MKMKKSQYSELSIQDRIWFRYSQKSALLVVPCSMVFGWESDVVVVTKAFISHEFEIKIDRQDFLQDKKKKKFKHFDMWMNGERKYTQTLWGNRTWEATVRNPPNFFWYVCPTELIQPHEVPVYAGLAWVEDWYLRVKKKPKKLHDERLPEKDVRQLCGSINARYWRMRVKPTDT